MAWRLGALGASLAVLVACQAAAAPAAFAPPTLAPVRTAVPAEATVMATDVAPVVLVAAASARLQEPTSTPAVPRPTATAVPATPTPWPPTPTPDATRAAQQHFCDTAAPPARLPLPPIGLSLRITPADSPSQPTSIAGGPRQAGAEPPPHVTAPSIAVLDEASGNLLYAREAFARRAPASVTKIVSTIVALERQPDVQAMYSTTVSAAALVACDGSSVMGLEPNDRVKLETLLYGMMLPSGNDAAEQVALLLGGSRARYVDWMNEEVAALRLRDTHFVTPSGMDADEQYSSAYDMAVLGRYAMQNPTFRVIAATSFSVKDDYYMHNLNPLLGSYKGADGVKIGYTEIAGRTMVASATRDGHRVYVSLMASRNLAADAIALFDWVWRTFRW